MLESLRGFWRVREILGAFGSVWAWLGVFGNLGVFEKVRECLAEFQSV